MDSQLGIVLALALLFPAPCSPAVAWAQLPAGGELHQGKPAGSCIHTAVVLRALSVPSSSPARSSGSMGWIWPAGHMLPTPGLVHSILARAQFYNSA